MRGWRSKFIFLLIVYFAGFATAIYTLVPAPESEASGISARSNDGLVARVTGRKSQITGQEFAKSFNAGMHKCIDFGKDAAWRTAKFIKHKIDERQLRTDI
ncbi:MAG: hypothetical protein ACYTFW_02285 [Planctomycetota bacterium]